MAEQATQTVEQDNPTGTPLDNPLSTSQGEEAIANWLGNLSGDNPEDTSEGSHEADAPEADENPETDNPDPVEETPEAVEEEAEQPRDAQGRFVSDDAKTKIGDEEVTIAELRNGYLRQRDYTQKTQLISETEQAISQRQDAFLRELNVIREFAQATMPQRPEMPAEPATVNPVAWAEYAQRQAEYDNMVQWANYLETTQQSAFQQKQQERQANAERAKAAQLEQINSAYKLTDKAKQDAFWNDLGARANKAYGVPAEEVKNLNSLVVVRMLRDALSFKESQSKVDQVRNGLSARPPLVQGTGKRQSPGQVEARSRTARVQRLRETGSTRDADAAILDFLK